MTVKPCLLVNPRSFRASRRGLAARAMRMVRKEGIEAHEVRDPPSVHARLALLRQQGVQQIWTLSGDGTIIALAEYLEEHAADWSPALLLLAGGRSNIVPRDVGGHPAMRALRRALAAWRAGRPLREEQIRTLSVAQDGQPTQYGFLWAGALVSEAVRLTSSNRAGRRGWWRQGLFSDPYVLLRWAFRTKILREPLPALPQVTANLPGVGDLSGSMRALVASSLQMRNAPYKPFAERGSGPVRFTAIRSSAPAMWRLLPAMLWGRFNDRLDVQRGILSGRSDQVELLGLADYALDGELFSADPARPLRLSAGRTLRVLRPDP